MTSHLHVPVSWDFLQVISWTHKSARWARQLWSKASGGSWEWPGKEKLAFCTCSQANFLLINQNADIICCRINCMGEYFRDIIFIICSLYIYSIISITTGCEVGVSPRTSRKSAMKKSLTKYTNLLFHSAPKFARHLKRYMCRNNSLAFFSAFYMHANLSMLSWSVDTCWTLLLCCVLVISSSRNLNVYQRKNIFFTTFKIITKRPQT